MFSTRPLQRNLLQHAVRTQIYLKPVPRLLIQTKPHHRTTVMSSVVNTVKSTLTENFTGAHGLASKEHQFSLEEVPDLTDKVAVITGGSQGIGWGCTYTMLTKNIKHVFILSMDPKVIDEDKKVISEEMGEETAKKMTWYHCDMGDFRQVKEVADKISKATDRIDILINNAGRGIMTFQVTDYGVDRHMAVNHMGHVILTSHLLPILKKTASQGNTVRIANQASNAHQGAPSDTKFETLDELNTDLGPNPQYGRSKLANILHARYLNKHLTSSHPNILANATHPGFVETKMSSVDIHEPYPVAGYAMSGLMKPLKKDNFEGAVSMMFAATKTTKSGEYICPPAVPEPGSKLAQDMALAEQLMKLTTEIVRDKTYEQSAAKGCPFKDY